MIVAGLEVPTPGLTVVQGPRLTDGSRRRRVPVGIVVHTSRGRIGPVLPGALESDLAETLARYQSRTPRQVSWHFTVDTDGGVVQSADPARWTCWHAGWANAWSVGIELAQHEDHALYAEQLGSLAVLCDALAARLGIARRVLLALEPVPSLRGGMVPFRGALAHAALTRERGRGDPGPDALGALVRAGWEAVTAEG